MSPLIRNLLLGIVLAVFIGYLAFQLQGFIFGSRLEVFAPQNGAHLHTSHIQVTGRAQNMSFLSLDGRSIFTDDEGFFEEELILPYGLNIMRIIGKGKFNRNLEEEMIVYVTGE